MALPPRWKMHRELMRLKRQIGDLRYRVTDPINRRIWDMRRDIKLIPEQGDIALTKDVAIFLIYQPKACPESLFTSLRCLVEAGFAPLVVSNLPLSDADRARLKPLAWQIAERPNLGYDFGGYRDGVYLVDRLGAEPDSLLFVNDTIWFPVSENSDLFERLRALEAPYLGMTDAYNFDFGGRNNAERPGRIHVTSFFFWLKKPVISSELFKAWWQNYTLYSRKRVVVREGEVGFFRAMEEAGFAYDALVKKDDLLKMLDSLDKEELIELLGKLSIVLSKFKGEHDAALAAIADGSVTRQQLFELIYDVVRVVNPSDLMAYEGIRRLNFPFLKKTILKNKRVRDHFLAENAKEPLDIDPQILKEMADLRYG
ncbi:MAG: rhamnan synthesis F family protein [Mangrovicoccus sp.]|nr:rhamnan synthesis F family protein [Mangrovicoccus sp.]